ncbi:MAG: TonB-dependent receptor [Bacteroidaceae bacterium]|nr:TonB-dependent receptor [Bacteroidaceae bacterium]
MMPISLPNQKATPLFDGTIKNDYWQLMPKFALQYDFNRQNNIYATVSRGTRSGGYNVQMFSDLLQGELRNQMMAQIKEGSSKAIKKMAEDNPRMPESVVKTILDNIDKIPVPESSNVKETVTYRPEYSWNFEIGTHLSTTNNRYQADAAIFLIDTRDQQIARFAASGLGRMMVNAGHSQSRGAELSLRGEIIDGLNLGLNYGYTYATFKDYNTKSAEDENTEDTKDDYSGNYVPFVPKHTVTFDASYTWLFQSSWAKRLTIGATYAGAGRIYWTESNNASQAYYSTLAARATLQMKHVQVEVWGRNLTNTKYNTFYFESMARGFAQHSKPLQVGIDVRLHF